MRGFTIIELIVSVVIILLMTGLLIAGYNQFNSNQVVIQAASSFTNNLRAVRTNARSGLKPSGCDTLIAYQVTFSTDSTYSSQAICVVGGSQMETGATTNYSLPTGVTFDTIPATITFYTAGQGITQNESITLRGQTKTQTIVLTETGLVGEFIVTPTP